MAQVIAKNWPKWESWCPYGLPFSQPKMAAAISMAISPKHVCSGVLQGPRSSHPKPADTDQLNRYYERSSCTFKSK